MTVESSDARRSLARDAVLRAATQLFGERGYTGTSMRDIAQEVGILPGSLYAHIDSKGALLREIIEGGVDRFNAAVAAVDARRLAPGDALREAIRHHLVIVADNPQRTLIVFHQWRFLDDADRVRLVAKRGKYEQFFLRQVRAGIAAGDFERGLDPKIAVFTILGALNWTPEWLNPGGRASPEDVAAKIAAGLLGGILARGSTSG